MCNRLSQIQVNKLYAAIWGVWRVAFGNGAAKPVAFLEFHR